MTLRIGTRGSRLALIQAEAVGVALAAVHADLAEPDALEVVVIKTTGDRVRDRALAEVGGKGMFTKEIEEALLDGAIDLAVHSLKDMPTWQPAGLVIACQLPREDPRDALIAPAARSIDGLPQGAVVGSASLRRQAQLLRRRPDLRITLIRGNVDTRLGKCADGEVDATVLAMAGLKRMGLETRPEVSPLAVSEMLPVVGQGAICVECREADETARRYLAAIDHAPTTAAVTAERALLAALDGSCRTPIAGFAELDGAGGLTLRGLVARPDGSEAHETSRRGAVADAAALGADAGAELRAAMGADFFADP